MRDECNLPSAAGLVIAAVLLSVQVTAAPFRGAVTLDLRPDPNNPMLGFLENTNANELIFIITNRSNAQARISNIFEPVATKLDKDTDTGIAGLILTDTNPCKGTTLVPTDVCAFSVLFDTKGDPNKIDVDGGRWQIGQSLAVTYNTVTPSGLPFPIPETVAQKAIVTIVDPAAQDVSAGAVPEPGTYLLCGFGLVAMALGPRTIRLCRARKR